MNENSGYKTAAAPRLMTINPKLFRLTPHARISGFRKDGPCVQETLCPHWGNLQFVLKALATRKGHCLSLTSKHPLPYSSPEPTVMILIISPTSACTLLPGFVNQIGTTRVVPKPLHCDWKNPRKITGKVSVYQDNPTSWAPFSPCHF